MHISYDNSVCPSVTA